MTSVPRARADALPDWLCSAGIALAAVGVAVQTASHLFQAFVAQSAWYLSADRDDNAFAWASSVATFAAAFAALCLYGLVGRRRLLVLAILLALFSLDDIATAHERLALHGESALDLAMFSRRYLWIVLFLPPLALGLALLLSVAREAPPRPRRLLLGGLVLLGVGVATEALTYLTFSAGEVEGTTLDAFEVVVEEGAELAGWILVAAALTAYFCSTLLAVGASPALARVK
jgi:hypothetical protein